MAYGDTDPYYNQYSIVDTTNGDGTDDLGTDYTDRQMVQDAKNRSEHIGEPNPSEAGIVNTGTYGQGPESGSLQGPLNPLPSSTGTGAVSNTDPNPMPGQKPTQGFNQPLLGGTAVTGPGGAGAGDLSSNGGPNGLTDKDRVVYNADGSIRGVKDASGYYSGDNWAGYDNIINNAQRGDPFAIDKVAALARLGDARASTVLGSTPGIGPNFKFGGEAPSGNNIFQSATFENWRRAHNAEVASTFGNKYDQFANTNQYAGQQPMNAIQGGNQPNEQVYNNWAGVNLDDIKKMMDATGRTYKGIDDYGNVHFQGNDGTQKVMPWWDARNQAKKLYDDYVAANPQPTGGGGGGYGTGYRGPGSTGNVPPGSTTSGNPMSGIVSDAATTFGNATAAGLRNLPGVGNPSAPNGVAPSGTGGQGGFPPYQAPAPSQYPMSTGYVPTIDPMTGTLDPTMPPSMGGVYSPPQAPSPGVPGFGNWPNTQGFQGVGDIVSSPPGLQVGTASNVGSAVGNAVQPVADWVADRVGNRFRHPFS